MRNDDFMDMSAQGRPETFMGQANVRIIFDLVGKDDELMNRINRTPRRASSTTATMELKNGELLYNADHVARTGNRSMDGTEQLAKEIRALFD